MVKKWQKAWEEDPEARHTYNMLPKANNKLHINLERMKRADARKYLEYITGHCHFRKHRKTMGGDNPSQCRFCDIEEETPYHLITQCDRTAINRLQILGSDHPTIEVPSHKLLTLLGKPSKWDHMALG